MTDHKSKESVTASAGINLTENIFISTLALTLEFAIIYFFTTILIFSGLYTKVWAIQTVGLLAIIHLISVPISYLGIRRDNRVFVLVGLLLSCIWFILIIVYIIVFIVNEFDGNDFKHRSLHHTVLVFYSVLDVVIVVMLSLNIINENKLQSLNYPPPTPAAQSPASPPQTSSPRPTTTSSEKKTLSEKSKSLKK